MDFRSLQNVSCNAGYANGYLTTLSATSANISYQYKLHHCEI